MSSQNRRSFLLLTVNSKGTTEKNAYCETCGLSSVDCVGHYAYIKLVVPIFHIGYFKHTLSILQCICKVRPYHPAILPLKFIVSRRVLEFFWKNLIGAFI